MSTYKLFFSLLLLIVISFESVGQAAKTPFSSFGLGETFGNGLTQNQGMGGLGTSYPEYWHLNNVNPALLVYNTITVFEAGFIGEQKTIKGDSTSEKSGNGNLNYLAMAFPIKRGKWGTGFGLMPYTTVNYRLNYIGPIENSSQTVDVIERGNGGITQLYWSNGIRLHPNISVGLKSTYYFGAIVNEFATALSESSQFIVYSNNIYDRQSYSGFGFSSGISYHIDSLFGKKNYQLNIGLVYDFQTDVRGKFFERFERRNAGGILDSVTLINNVPFQSTFPQTWAGGVSFGKGLDWMIGADFTYIDYSKFTDYYGSASGANKGWQFTLGGKIIPDAGSVSNYLKRVTYRTGVSLSEAPFLINGSALRDFGINFGLSLPVSRISSLDMAIKVGKRGDLQTNTIEENYFKLYFGVTFNDQWFIKRRFD